MAPAHHAVAQLAVLLQRARGSRGLWELGKCPVQCIVQFTALGNNTAQGDGLCGAARRPGMLLGCSAGTTGGNRISWGTSPTSFPPAKRWSSGSTSTVRPRRFAWQVQLCGFHRVPKGTPSASSHHICVLTQPKADRKGFLLEKAASSSMSWGLSHTAGIPRGGYHSFGCPPCSSLTTKQLLKPHVCPQK